MSRYFTKILRFMAHGMSPLHVKVRCQKNCVICHTKMYRFMKKVKFNLNTFEDRDDEGIVSNEHHFAISSEHPADTGYRPPISYWEALNHLIKAIMGPGVFAMGSGFKNSGIIMGAVFFVVLYVITLNSLHDLVSLANGVAAREVNQKVRPNIGETVTYTYERGPKKIAKYSRQIGLLVRIVLICTEFGQCCTCYVFVVDHVRQIMHNTLDIKISVYLFYALAAIPLLSFALLGSFKSVSLIAVCGNILTIFGLAIIMIEFFKDTSPIGSRALYKGYYDVTLFIGTFVFAMDGTAFILAIRNEMANPKDFSKPLGVANIGMTFSGICCFMVGFFGYGRFGEEIDGNIFISFDQKSKLIQGTDFMISVSMLCTYSVHMLVIYDATYPPFHAKYSPFKYPRTTLFLFRAGAVFITFLISITVPYLELIVSLNGAVIGGVLTILPYLLHLVVLREEMGFFSILKNFLLVIFGVCFMFSGIAVSIGKIVDAYRYKRIEER